MNKPRFAFVFLVLALIAVVPLQAVTLTGQVTDEGGQPVAGVNLNFEVSATGHGVNMNNDGTDLNGNFTVLIDPPDVYDIFFIPPAGVSLAAHVEPDVDLTVDRNINIVLLYGYHVTGAILRADNGLPATNVDLDFEDLTTGVRIFTPRDNSDPAGVYNVVVPPGIYEVTYDGPVDNPPQLAHHVIEEVCVDGSTDIGLPGITLELGYVLDGEVFRGFGIPVAGADLDLVVPATGDTIFTKNDNTNASGLYETIVPAGTYDVEITPPAGLALASVRHAGVVVAADTSLGVDVMAQGLAVTGTVRDPDGRALPDVDLDLASSASGTPVPTGADNTDASGQYQVYAAPGTYDINYDPLVNNLVEQTTSFGVGVGSDPTLLPDVILPYHDEDADGVVDVFDGCPFDADLNDQDLDGIDDGCDNCPSIANARQEDGDLDRLGDACDPDDDNDGIVDAIDPDLDGDGVSNLGDNCPQAFNPSQDDSDVDGTGDACDPDDGEVEYLEARSEVGFVWRPETGATGYQVYRQRIGWLCNISYGKCFQQAAEGTVLVDVELPPPGGGFAYLVTAETAGGEGSLGRRSDGVERPNLRSCP